MRTKHGDGSVERVGTSNTEAGEHGGGSGDSAREEAYLDFSWQEDYLNWLYNELCLQTKLDLDVIVKRLREGD